MSHNKMDGSRKKLLFLSLGALGVVYGDIGTSPLYAVNEVFFGHGQLTTSPENILGAISLIIWAITAVISFKYVVYVLKADNDGEGGVFALSNLINKLNIARFNFFIVVSTLLIFAAGLLFGDGIITPAISVISAVEGLEVITPALKPLVVPITIVILTGLFMFQKKGTHKVGSIFGPIILLWFAILGTLGFVEILKVPQIIQAFNPIHAILFLLHTSIFKLALVMGSVMLTITGGEAMYADMGHFGRKPIRISWFSVVYPCLILNYLGQGAYLLSGSTIVNDNIFYSLVPKMFLYPMVILATMATVIASQALISGAFSLAAQAVTLDLLPRLKIIQTHHEHEGQKYVPFINWSLYLGAVFLVITFKSSTNLASAYGLAVSGVMFVTTLAMLAIARYKWGWSKFKALAIFLPFLAIDTAFLLSNSIKVFEGGFIPLLIGISLWAVMKIWNWGKTKVRSTYSAYSTLTIADLLKIKSNAKCFIPRSMVVMTPTFARNLSDYIPTVKQMLWERYQMLPQDLLFLTVQVTKDPYVKTNKYEVVKFLEDSNKGSIISVRVNFGFMEELNVEETLVKLAKLKEINIDEDPKNWLVHIQKERLMKDNGLNTGIKSLMFNIYNFMVKISDEADHFFGLGNKMKLSIEVMPVKLS